MKESVSLQVHVDRSEQGSTTQSRLSHQLCDEGEAGGPVHGAQAGVNVVKLSQNTMSDMESGSPNQTFREIN